MRDQLCDALVARAADTKMVFMTGDLGYQALEPLREAMGDRFINAGVAEQNMITAAAAMASQGLEPWVYSIAPFVYARPFEQIRNDVCFNNLPVKLIGNGGGYGYGVMGPTHHAIDDYGSLLTLPDLIVVIPAFNEDVGAAVAFGADLPNPCYLRLGRGDAPTGWTPPAFEPWRQLTYGDGPVVIGVGPLTGTYISDFQAMLSTDRPNLWVAGALPIDLFPVPAELLEQLERTGNLVVAEEHVGQGSVAAQILLHFARSGITIAKFVHLRALAHSFGTYGSQNYLRKLSALDPSSMLQALGTF
jgi:transketolase